MGRVKESYKASFGGAVEYRPEREPGSKVRIRENKLGGYSRVPGESWW